MVYQRRTKQQHKELNQMKEKQSVLKACEYTLQKLQSVRRAMVDIGNKNQKIVWAVGSMIIVITANVTKIVTEVIENASKTSAPDAKQDLIEIKTKIVEFLDNMIGDME